jgi:hypothetical protein
MFKNGEIVELVVTGMVSRCIRTCVISAAQKYMRVEAEPYIRFDKQTGKLAPSERARGLHVRKIT